MNQPSRPPLLSARTQAMVLSALMAFVCVVAINSTAPPSPLPADVPAAEFSAERAATLLAGIAREPHPLGVPAHDAVRDTILEMWRDLGFKPEVQHGLFVGSDNRYGARVENILVRLRGRNPSPGRALMLSTHYDSVASSPGAADDGAGVVTLLETARALGVSPQLEEDIIFLITDAEEDGLIGARVFRDRHPWAKDVGLALNFEARGTAGPSLMFETSRGNSRLIDALASVPYPQAYSFSGTVYRNMPNDTDLSVFIEGGMQGLNFAFGDRPYHYHSPDDSLDNLDLRSLQHHGSYALALARRFGTEGVPPRAKGDAVYFSLLGDVFVHYSAGVAFALAGAIAVLVLAAGAIAFTRRIVRFGRVLIGILFTLGAIILAAGLGYGFLAAVKASHGAWLPGGFYRYNAFYLLALVFLTLAATAWLYGRIRVRSTGLEIALGASIAWASLTVWVTLSFPEASYPVSWPAVLLNATVFLWAWRRDKSGCRDASPEPLSGAAASVIVALVAAPVVSLFFLAMFLTPLFAAILAALTALMATSISPALEIMRRGLRWALPAALAALFVSFAVAGAMTTKYNDRIPRPTSLTYVADYDQSRAFWVAPANEVVPWTEEAAGGKLEPGHPLPAYAGRPDSYRFRTAPWRVQQPPEVRLIGDVTEAGVRTLRFRLVSPRGGRQLVAAFEAEKILQVSLEGQILAPPARSGNRELIVFMNPGRDGFEAALQVSAGSAVSVSIRESDPGLDAPSGFALPPPPPSIQLRRVGVLFSKTFTFPPPQLSQASGQFVD